jgi:hypothetical protein
MVATLVRGIVAQSDELRISRDVITRFAAM